MSVNVDRPIGHRMVGKTRIFRTSGAFFSLLMIGGMTAWALCNPYSPLVLKRPVTKQTSHAVVLPNKTADHFRRSEEHLPAIETPEALIEQRGQQDSASEVAEIEGVEGFQPMLGGNKQLELQHASMKQLENDRNAWLVAHRQEDWFKNRPTKTLGSRPGSPRENNASIDVALVQPYPNAHQVVREEDAVAGKPTLAVITNTKAKTTAMPKPIPPPPSLEVASLPAELQNFASTGREPVEGNSSAFIEATDAPQFLPHAEEAALRPWESGQY